MAELQEAEVTEQLESPPAQQTAGSLLRQAREAAGMHVSSLADVLKVPVAKLQALEADDWQALPDAVFTRSVALSICKALQVDAAPVMALLPKSAATQKFTAPGPGINEPFRDKAVRSVHDTPNPGGAWKWLALALLAGAGGGVWYFAQKQDLRDAVVASVQERSERAMGTSQSAHTVDVAPPEAPAAEAVAAQEPVAPVAAEAAAPAVAAVPAPAAVAEAPAASATPAAAVAPAVAAPAEAAAAAPAAPVAAATGSATLRIQARAATWIQVRGGGKVLEQKTLNAGDFFETQAPKPLSVVIGRADAAEVQVGGAAFDLGAVARENVARFEVK
ncbi:helix-turn-helix domain-containing protein [Comamonas sp. 17RB]|uniref:helix-turn-helix domain-containing protein n=1 Tax=Comamonas sp. 17RB TaxID=3047025 RepID=UPI0024B6DF39|nr:helix-turn-helix domain-containing protein [Comamonas sp. 17RB]MDI9855392.1 helix-turn-helix domain-containing protein [Comamonas sp. 17RB]